MRYLRAEPPLFDIAAWRERLAELLAEADRSETLIEQARAHIAALEAPPATEAAGAA